MSTGLQKSDAAFRTISEVSEALDVPNHVLRFWETRFSQIKPTKRGGGRRYYRPEDVELLVRIKALLYVDGFTIKGVQKLLKQHGVKGLLSQEFEAGTAQTEKPADERASAVGRGVLDELKSLKSLVDRALSERA